MNEISEEEQTSNEVEEINENLEEVIGSFTKEELSLDTLREIAEAVRSRIEQIKMRELPPIEREIEEIKEQLNKKYSQEKNKFKTLEELEELEGRNSVCTRLLQSYELRENIDELVNYSNEVIDELHFDISDYDSISGLNFESVESWEN